MTGQAADLLARLDAVGARLVLGEAGGLELSGKRPPAALLGEVRASKAELLAALSLASTEPPVLLSTVEGKAVPEPAPLSPRPVQPLTEPLPAHLAVMVDAAKAGQLPGGVAHLASGLVTDLGGYVTAWAECWPGDRVHVLRRLEEAYAVTVRS
ncbi:hypothetical protein [Deinococcus sp.]|uniref:hypothetical protein n=1 Tax=Deinococcus sp. TaxID=47478 RepID=UPI0025DB25A5|nr:hypothetical protein [Deinococcus sp.]